MKTMLLLVTTALLFVVTARYPSEPAAAPVEPPRCEPGEWIDVAADTVHGGQPFFYCTALPCRSWESLTVNGAGRVACRLADRHRRAR